MTVKTSGTSAEDKLFMDIGRRAVRELKSGSPVKIALSVAGCHLNGCPIRLNDLLNAETQDFIADIKDICTHTDDETYAPDEGFRPRFADTLDKAAEEGRTVTATDYLGDLAMLWCARAEHLKLEGIPAAKDALAFFSGAASYAAATGGSEAPVNIGTFCRLIRQAGVKPIYQLRDMTVLRRAPPAVPQVQ